MDISEKRRQKSEQIISLLEQRLPALLGQYPVDAAYVYGSIARGTATPLSDIDIALLLTHAVSPYDRLKLELTIQGDIATMSDLISIDVRSINDAPLMVQGRIVQEGKLIYERDHARRVNFEVMTRKRYFDFAPTARRLQNAFLDRVHEDGILYD
jgi:predicted nucleotidyltransferase